MNENNEVVKSKFEENNVSKKVKLGIVSALTVKDIITSGEYKEVDCSGISSVVGTEIITERTLLFQMYGGFVVTAAVRLDRETNTSFEEIKSFLSTSQAQNKIIYMFSNESTVLELEEIEPVNNALFSELFDNRGNLREDVPDNVNSPEFVNFVYDVVKDAFMLKSNCGAESYGLNLINDLPHDVEHVYLPSVIEPCEVRAPRDMPYVENKATGRKVQQRPPTFIEIVDKLIYEHGLKMVDVDGASSLVIYDRDCGHYVGGTDIIEAIIAKYIYRHADSKILKEVFRYIRNDRNVPVVKKLPKNYIIMKNCVVDVASDDGNGGYLCYALSPSWVSQHYFDVDYNPGADSSFIYQVLHDGIACRKDDVYKNLLEIPAFILYPEASKYVFILHNEDCKGDASNGKSTYLSLCKELAKGHCTSLDIQEIGGTEFKYTTANLENSLCNVGDDISNAIVSNQALSKIKTLVTGGSVSAFEKFVQGTREMRSVAQHIYACNEMPRFCSDKGFSRRLHLVPMNAHFSPNKVGYIHDMDKILLSNVENVQAFAKLALDTLHEMFEKNHFHPTNTKEAESMKSDFETDNSVVLQWVEDRGWTRENFAYRGNQFVVLDASDYDQDELIEISKTILGIPPAEFSKSKLMETPVVMTSQKIFQDYKIWCKYRGYQAKQQSQFNKEFESVMSLRKQRKTRDENGKIKKEQSKPGYLGASKTTSHNDAKQFYRLPDGSDYRFACESENEAECIEEVQAIVHRLATSEKQIISQHFESNDWAIPDCLK